MYFVRGLVSPPIRFRLRTASYDPTSRSFEPQSSQRTFYYPFSLSPAKAQRDVNKREKG